MCWEVASTSVLSEFIMETEKMDQDVSADAESASSRVVAEEAKDEGIYLEPKEETTSEFSWLQFLMDSEKFNSRHHGEGNSKSARNYESLSHIGLLSSSEKQFQKANIKVVHIECSHCGNRYQKNVRKTSSKRSDCKQKKESRRFRKKMRNLTKLLEKL